MNWVVFSDSLLVIRLVAFFFQGSQTRQPWRLYFVWIPKELTRGKQFVIIRFQSPLEGAAGGVFDVRIVNTNP